jgi:DNA-directed RNA polymerase subunit E'/Rpb7
LDPEEVVRFQVQSIEFQEVRPWAANRPEGKDKVNAIEEAKEEGQVPFRIIGNMTTPGLGPLTWWQHSE